MLSHAEAKMDPVEAIHGKIQTLFNDFGLDCNKYPLFQELLGTMVGIKVGFFGPSKISESMVDLLEADRDHYGFMLFSSSHSEKNLLFCEALNREFPNLILRRSNAHPALDEKPQDANAHPALNEKPQDALQPANKTIELLSPSKYGIFIHLQKLEEIVLPAMRKFLSSPQVLKRLNNCTQFSATVSDVFQQFQNIVEPRKITMHSRFLIDSMCLLAKASTVPSDCHISPNTANRYSIDFDITLVLKDAELIVAYFNQLQPGSAYLEELDHLEKKMDHRLFPKISKMQLTLDSSVLLSENFITAFKEQMQRFDDRILERYRFKHNENNFLQLPKRNKQTATLHTYHAYLPSAKTMTLITGAAALGFFTYRVIAKPQTLTQLCKSLNLGR